MKCNLNISLGVISIIIIISISILILYKNIQDNDIEYFSMPQKQNVANQLLIFNNNLINKLSNDLTNIQPTIGFPSDPIEVDNEYQQSMSNSILSQASDMSSTYANNNKLTSEQITSLENNVKDLENIINNNKNKNRDRIKYNNIKSLNNGMEMNVISTPNTIFQDQTTGKITNAYLVNVNNGCLSVGSNDYDVYKCNDKNPKQFFNMKHIINETDYENNIDKSYPFDKVDKTGIHYPFTMLKSSNTDECLTNNHGSLTVQPCYSLISQRWIAL
jgi:hypothetical protein